MSTGLLMGVKAAALFLASAAFFCDEAHPEQCLTTAKASATVIVLLGTAVYYWPGDLSCEHCFPRKVEATPGSGAAVADGGGGGSSSGGRCSGGGDGRNGGGGGGGTIPSTAAGANGSYANGANGAHGGCGDVELGDARRPKGRQRRRRRGSSKHLAFSRLEDESERRSSAEEMAGAEMAGAVDDEEEAGAAADVEDDDSEDEVPSGRGAAEQGGGGGGGGGGGEGEGDGDGEGGGGSARALRVELAASRRESDALRAELRSLQARLATSPAASLAASPQGAAASASVADPRGGGGVRRERGGAAAEGTPPGGSGSGGGSALGHGHPTPKCNGTPLPLASPIDEDCCRTPLEPTTSRPARHDPSEGAGEGAGGGAGGAVFSLPMSPLARTPQARGAVAGKGMPSLSPAAGTPPPAPPPSALDAIMKSSAQVGDGDHDGDEIVD